MPEVPDSIGVILIDHGSKKDDANAMLLGVVAMFRKQTGIRIVEPAHMELAEPTLDQAFAACIEQGATEIVIHPYFLAPGRHSTSDIPRMAEASGKSYPGIPYRVTESLGIDARIGEVILKRVQDVLSSPG